MRHARLYSKTLLFPDLTMCCTSGDTHSQKGTYNTSLFQLHWLPVCFRSLYKIMFHTFKVLSGTALLYLTDLIEKHMPVRML